VTARAAIFDVDGVLVDSPHERAWRETLVKLLATDWHASGVQATSASDAFSAAFYEAQVAGKPREEGGRAVLTHFGIADPDGRRLREYCESKQALLLSLIRRREFEVYDDAIRLLLALKNEQLLVAAASSSRNATALMAGIRVDELCAKDGLSYAFVHPGMTLGDTLDADVSGWHSGPGKPSPGIFLAAADRLSVAPERCVVVEDAVAGVVAAKAGRMACVAVSRHGDPAPLRSAGADVVVTDLTQVDVPRLLAA
jgi:beta-phosphoglucomutase